MVVEEGNNLIDMTLLYDFHQSLLESIKKKILEPFAAAL